jgi:hypothetical protein
MEMGPFKKMLRWSVPAIPFVGETNAAVPLRGLGYLDFLSFD